MQDALSRGAKLLRGGARHELGGTFYQPTILTDVTKDMLVCQQETFGPVAPLIRFVSSCVKGICDILVTKEVVHDLPASTELSFGC